MVLLVFSIASTSSPPLSHLLSIISRIYRLLYVYSTYKHSLSFSIKDDFTRREIILRVFHENFNEKFYMLSNLWFLVCKSKWNRLTQRGHKSTNRFSILRISLYYMLKNYRCHHFYLNEKPFLRITQVRVPDTILY